MQTKSRLISLLIVTTLLGGCVVENEPLDSEVVLDDDADSANNSVADLSGDTLIAPTAPILTMAAAPGALQLSWVDRDNESNDLVTEISLYEYNETTGQEKLVTSLSDVTRTSYVHTVTPHQFAWDAISFRVEICTQANCLSSQRNAASDLLANSLSSLTADDSQLSVTFGDDVAVNANGTVAVVSSPLNASALVFFHVSDQWIQASTLTSQSFNNSDFSGMKVSASATGETIAVASLSSRSAPRIAIFDLIGENWIETGTIISTINFVDATDSWDINSLRVAMSNNGERLVMGAQEANPSANDANNRYNRLWVYDRSQLTWTQSALLSVPVQHVRVPSFAGNGDLDRVYTLSGLNGNLYISEFNLATGNWLLASQQFLSGIRPTVDITLNSSDSGDQIALAAWDAQSDGQRAAVGWRLAKSDSQWIGVDSVRLPPTNNALAQLRLAADASLDSVAIGWQANSSANLAFFKHEDSAWQHLFSIPSGLNLTRQIGLAQSVVISADNSTALVGTSNTGNGGLVTVFK